MDTDLVDQARQHLLELEAEADRTAAASAVPVQREVMTQQQASWSQGHREPPSG